MESKSFFWLVPAIVSLTAIGSAQNLEKSWDGKIENQNGIVIIANSGRPIYETNIFILKEELSIGKTEGAPEFLFSTIDDFDVDAEGNVYISDRKSAQIRVFDQEGRFLRTIGRRGQGPGEFQMVMLTQITSKGELLAYDFLTAKLTYFNLAGNFLKQTVFPKVHGFAPGRIDSQGRLIGQDILAPAPIGGVILKIVDSEGINSREIFKVESDLTKKGKQEFDIGKPRNCYTVSDKDQIYWGYPDQYEIKVIDSAGKLLKIIRNQSNRIEISKDDKTAFEKSYADEMKSGWKLVFRDHYPFFKEISIDDHERLFIQTYEKANGYPEHSYYDIYSQEGKYLAKVPIPANLNSHSVWKGDKVYTLETDPEGFEKITRYKIEWNFDLREISLPCSWDGFFLTAILGEVLTFTWQQLRLVQRIADYIYSRPGQQITQRELQHYIQRPINEIEGIRR